MANYMEQVAEIIGVSVGEVFAITCWNCYFRFTKKQLEMREERGGWFKASSEFLEDIICGKQQVIKLVWIPKHLEKYWTYYGDMFEVGEAIWEGCAADYARLKSGMMFLSEKKANAARQKVYERLTGKKWEGDTT